MHASTYALKETVCLSQAFYLKYIAISLMHFPRILLTWSITTRNKIPLDVADIKMFFYHEITKFVILDVRLMRAKYQKVLPSVREID